MIATHNKSSGPLDCRAALAQTIPLTLRNQLWPESCPPPGDYAHRFPAAPLPFVEQDSATVKAAGGYEPYIASHGAVPTRSANWHDYYNALGRARDRQWISIHPSQSKAPPSTALAPPHLDHQTSPTHT